MDAIEIANCRSKTSVLEQSCDSGASVTPNQPSTIFSCWFFIARHYIAERHNITLCYNDYRLGLFYTNRRCKKVIKPYPHVQTNIFTSPYRFVNVDHRAQKADTKWWTVDTYARVKRQNLTGK